MQKWNDKSDNLPSILERFGEPVLGLISVIVLLALTASIVMLLTSTASAHPGGLAADGCHMDRKTGIRHCHRSSSQQPQARQERRSGGTVYYRNCDAARAAGVTPIRRGQPGYARHLDRDNDGVACE